MRTVWTDELIVEAIKDAMNKLQISRMPTGEELKSIGRNDLHCKISRTKKYSGWAKDLGLKLKRGSTTRLGNGHEEATKDWLWNRGFDVELTSYKYPYDLFVNGCVKVDVKASSPYHTKYGTKYIYARMGAQPTCDIYIFVALDDNGQIKARYVVPSHVVKQETLNLREQDFKQYANNSKLILDYNRFYLSVM